MDIKPSEKTLDLGEKVSCLQARAAWSLSPVINFIVTAALAVIVAIEAMTRDKPAAG